MRTSLGRVNPAPSEGPSQAEGQAEGTAWTVVWWIAVEVVVRAHTPVQVAEDVAPQDGVELQPDALSVQTDLGACVDVHFRRSGRGPEPVDAANDLDGIVDALCAGVILPVVCEPTLHRELR